MGVAVALSLLEDIGLNLIKQCLDITANTLKLMSLLG